MLEEWGVGGPRAAEIVAALIEWWDTAEDAEMEPIIVVLNTAGDPCEVGAANFLEKFGVDLDRMVAEL